MVDPCLDLKGARERLARAQVSVQNDQERRWIQDALDIVDRVGVLECPGWSKFDEPTVSDDSQRDGDG